MLCTQNYDLDVVYVSGNNMLLANTLSRAYLPECPPLIWSLIQYRTEDNTDSHSKDTAGMAK